VNAGFQQAEGASIAALAAYVRATRDPRDIVVEVVGNLKPTK